MSSAKLSGRVDSDVVPASSSDDAVRRTVLQLNALCKRATLEFTLAVGELVLTSLYGGDIGRLRSRRRKDHLALRRVVADPDLSMSASTLYRCVAIFEVCERIGAQSWKHVSTTHVRMVLSLPPKQQEQLLRETETNRWGIRDLEQRVAVIANNQPRAQSRGGRKRRTRLRTLTDHLRKETGEIADLLALHEDAIADSSQACVQTALEALEQMMDVCSRMAERLKSPRRSGFHFRG
jgi:hypothetical protein